jgi:hypothetical protein
MGKYDILDAVYPPLKPYGVLGKSPVEALFSKAPGKPNTFYVITRPHIYGGTQYRGVMGSYDVGPWKNSLAGAVRHLTLADAARELVVAIDKKNADAQIVRVTEVPGKSETKLVSKTNINATKPVVLYNPKTGNYQRTDGKGGVLSAPSLQDATVFSDLSDAFAAFHSEGVQAQKVGAFPTVPAIVHAHQVERITTPVTFTEVVVS